MRNRMISARLHALAVLALSLTVFLASALPGAATTIQRVVSPGGIEAWLVEDATVPLIAVAFAFRGGSAQDPDGRPGVANMMSGLLDEGAGDLDSQAFQARLDELSIELSFDAGRDAFFGSLRTLTDNRDEAFRLLRLAVNEPRFDEEPVARIRAQIASGMRRDLRDPETIAGRTMSELSFPGHPYGRSPNGDLETLAAITADDLRAFRQSTFARGNLLISVVGAIDAATLGAKLDEVFGGLPEKPDLKPVAEAAPAAGIVKQVDMAIPQTIIRFALPGLKREDPDFIPAFVANHILGGGSFSSRLYSEVREKRGLAYSVGTSLQSLDHAGMVYGGTATRADRADETVSIIESELRRFGEEGPTAEEVAKAKSYLIGSYPLRFTTSTRIANQLLGIQLDELGIDYIDRRNDLIAAVTEEEVRAVARRLFAGAKLTVVRVGQPGA